MGFFDKITKVLGPVATIASVIPGPHQPFTIAGATALNALGGSGGGQSVGNAASYGMGQPTGYPREAIDHFMQAERIGADADYQAALRGYAASQANSAAAAANANARSAAAAATDKNRRKALKKSMKFQRGREAENKAMYQPWVDAGREALPIASELYKGGANTATMLRNYLESEQAMKKLSASQPAYNIKPPKFSI